MEDKCYLCIRVPAEEVLKMSHFIWDDNKELGRKIGLEASRIVEETYHMNPTIFCGKSRKVILGGLFYLMGFLYGCRKKQYEISKKINCSSTNSIHNSAKLWIEARPELFSKYKKEVTIFNRNFNNSNMKTIISGDWYDIKDENKKFNREWEEKSKMYEKKIQDIKKDMFI